MSLLAPRSSLNEVSHRMQIADAANAALRGELLNTGTVTIVAGATSTTITDARLGVGKLLLLTPLDAYGAGLAWHLESMGNGSCVVGHSALAHDAAFGWVVIGSGATR